MQVWILILFVWKIFATVVTADLDYTTVCNQVTCQIDHRCVTRRFWCGYTACPTMAYCSKSQLESLRGPDTCETVICPDGYKCAIQFRDCSWDHGCKQRFARCVSIAELADEPASCANVKCGTGHCILRETHYCPKPPCRLTKSCANLKDVEIWFEKCRQMGCRSEQDCFLRKHPEDCISSSCSHIPDCLATPDIFESSSNKLCHGWICPPNQVCSVRLPPFCNSPTVNCPVTRSCNRNLRDHTEHADTRMTLSDIERDIFLEEQRRLQKYIRPSSTSNSTHTNLARYYDALPADQSWENSDDATSALVQSRRVGVNPFAHSSSPHINSAWLIYLKRQAGAEAVQYWMDKARMNQDYQGFVEWLDKVSQLLDPEDYRLWLMEVQAATATVPEFQAWISSRNIANHRVTTQRSLPISIDDRAKNLFYSDKNLGFPDQLPVEFGVTSQQSSNFKFNEASQWEDGPLLARLKIPVEPQARSDINYGLPQDFGEAINNSWKSWQSLYQTLPEFTSRTDNTHMDNNYTNIPQQDASAPKMFYMDSRYALKRNNDDIASRDLPRPEKEDNDSLPNLLIYFPPPLNIFIHYSLGNRNNTNARNVSSKTNGADHPSLRFGLGTKSSDGGYVLEDYDDKPEYYNKSGSVDKQKEFEFIRKIIRELINWWDDQEQEFVKSKKYHDGGVGVRMGNFHQSPSHIIGTQTDGVKSTEDEQKPSMNAFMEWLLKNGHVNSTKLSELRSKIKNPLINDDHRQPNINSPNSENNNNTTTGKIRILVDVDKNSEIMKKLFGRNNTADQNDSNPHQYQVIVNLDESNNPREEDSISSRLINKASNLLHRNTEDKKMPKVLWVFPVYGNEDNGTIMNEIKKRSREKVITLEDVDVPTGSNDDHEHTHDTSINFNGNRGNNKQSDIKNVQNFNNPMNDTEDEYYQDQDMYDENDYEQSEFDQATVNGTNKK